MKDIILLFIVGGFVLAVWYAFRNLEKVAGSQLGELDKMTTKPLPPEDKKDV
ncbi:MAG: hypothetical protein QM723_22210 [Myxococcaceae bacterium]